MIKFIVYVLFRLLHRYYKGRAIKTRLAITYYTISSITVEGGRTLA